MKTIPINEGGIWENGNFQIITDYKVNQKYENKCTHIKDGKLRAIIVAFNEGGFNSTGVCVDCIMEACRNNNIY